MSDTSDTKGCERIGRPPYGMWRACDGFGGLASLARDERITPALLEKSRALAERYKMLEARRIADVDAVEDRAMNALPPEAR